LFPLHENLWRFLNWAWSRQIFDRWIWTDRICLNQENEKKMAQQILRMGEIFHDAKQTLSWLDMSEQDGEDIIYLRDCAEKGLNCERAPHETQQVADQIRKNEYWTRVWIAQEVGRAKR
ncbi:heterokaryon incompatibility, partial [Phyllosticta citrichinensis]